LYVQSMNAISSPVQALLDLFTAELAELRFADVDANVLARLAADTHTAAEAVSVAQATLDTARSALQERQDTLLAHAQRAHAYARVYAEGDDALLVRLDAITLPRAARRARTEGQLDALVLSAEPSPAPRVSRRGRPRKSGSEEAESPVDASSLTESSSELAPSEHASSAHASTGRARQDARGAALLEDERVVAAE